MTFNDENSKPVGRYIMVSIPHSRSKKVTDTTYQLFERPYLKLVHYR